MKLEDPPVVGLSIFSNGRLLTLVCLLWQHGHAPWDGSMVWAENKLCDNQSTHVSATCMTYCATDVCNITHMVVSIRSGIGTSDDSSCCNMSVFVSLSACLSACLAGWLVGFICVMSA